MPRTRHPILAVLALAAATTSGETRAQELPPQRTEASPAPGQQTGAPASPRLTGKERLAGKWTDEQRADNCNVPPDKRGDRPRPDCEPAR